jgi:osmotically-inducible protein OsmY
MMPRPETDCPSPQRVTQAANARLRSSPYPDVQRILCECSHEGVIFLRGWLPSFYQKQLAQEAVASVPGVTQVVNDTEVAS